MEFWIGQKILFENRRKMIFSLIGVIGAVMSIIVTLSLREGSKEIINSDLMALGENRILIGGTYLNERDLKLVESFSFVEYGVFPEAKKQIEEYVFIGYGLRALEKKGLKNLRGNEIAVDQNEILDGIGTILNIEGQKYVIKETYMEKNPLELIKKEKKIIISMETLNRNFGKEDYKNMIIAFPRGEDVQEYIPIILNQLSKYRGVNDRIHLLETPEIYKSVERVRVLINRILFTLSFISIGIGTFGVINLMGASVRNNIITIGILKSMGVKRKSIIKIFFYQGSIVIVLGSALGSILGILGSYIGGALIRIPPKFNLLEIIIIIVLTMSVALILGLKPGIKGSKMDGVDALKG